MQVTQQTSSSEKSSAVFWLAVDLILFDLTVLKYKKCDRLSIGILIQFHISARSTKGDKICQLRKAIFSIFYKILWLNFVFIQISVHSF